MANLLQTVKTYKMTYPRAQKDVYLPQSSIDWLIKIDPGYEIVKNSIFISGNIFITRDGAPYNPYPGEDEDYSHAYYDNFAGWHTLFDVFSTDINQQNIENFDSYPRYMRMASMASLYRDELSGNLSSTVEGKNGSYWLTNPVLVGEVMGTEDIEPIGMPINIKPYICVNRPSRNITSNDAPIGILIHTKLSPSNNVLFGPDADPTQNDMNYYLRNLQLNWQVQPISKSSNLPLVLGKISWKDYTLTSKVSSVEIEVPIPTQNIVMSTVLYANSTAGPDPDVEANGLWDNPHSTATNFLNCESVQFFLNNTDNKLLSFELEDLEEQIMNYKYAMNENEISGIDDITVQGGKNFSTFGLGLNMSGLLPIGTKINMVLNTNDDNGPDPNRPWTLHCYMKGMVTM